LLSTIPASVYGFASIAGLIILDKSVTPTTALVPTILSIIIGAIFGFVSEALMNALKKK
jgi:ammonia channel protein AmtB